MRLIDFLTLLNVLLLAIPQFAIAAKEGGNGGGIAEKNISYAYLNLENFISICLNSGSCRLTFNEKKLLNTIKLSMPRERKVLDQIQFGSGKEKPGFFVVHGHVRVAKTGDAVGNTIFINTDLLYPTSINGDLDPVSLPRAVSILVHEFGHHHGVKNHAALDLLGSKVEASIFGRWQETKYILGNGKIMRATVIEGVYSSDSDRLLMSTELALPPSTKEMVDFTDVLVGGIESASHCRGKIGALHLSNMRWRRARAEIRDGDKYESFDFPLIRLYADFNFACGSTEYNWGPIVLTTTGDWERDSQNLNKVHAKPFEFLCLANPKSEDCQ